MSRSSGPGSSSRASRSAALRAVTICVSALLYSSLIAYMSNLILASDVNWTAHKQKVETIKSYMRHRKIPTDLQTRIEEYLDYLWTTQKGLDETDITSMLPATLRQQLSLFCNSRIISTVPLFVGLPAHVCAATPASQRTENARDRREMNLDMAPTQQQVRKSRRSAIVRSARVCWRAGGWRLARRTGVHSVDGEQRHERRICGGRARAQAHGRECERAVDWPTPNVHCGSNLA